MKYNEHHLSEHHDKIICPLNRNYTCTGRCAWFDHVHEDCRMIGGFWRVREGLNEIIDLLGDKK